MGIIKRKQENTLSTKKKSKRERKHALEKEKNFPFSLHRFLSWSRACFLFFTFFLTILFSFVNFHLSRGRNMDENSGPEVWDRVCWLVCVRQTLALSKYLLTKNKNIIITSVTGIFKFIMCSREWYEFYERGMPSKTEVICSCPHSEYV